MRRLTLPVSTLAHWAKVAQTGKLGEIGKTQRPLTEIELELAKTKRELKEVKMERDLLKKATAYLDEVDDFDDKIVVGFGDVDFCLRAGAKGYRVLFCPYVQLVHHESFTRGKSTEDPHPEDSAYFQRKWKGPLKAGEPYCNSNLSVFSTAWHVKFPMTYDLVLRRRLYKTDHARVRQEIVHSLSGVQ